MRQVIGFNLISFGITLFIILVMYDGTLKEKMTFIIAEPIILSIISWGAWLMNN